MKRLRVPTVCASLPAGNGQPLKGLLQEFNRSLAVTPPPAPYSWALRLRCSQSQSKMHRKRQDIEFRSLD